MLWRESYRPNVRYNVPLPGLADGIVVGVFDVHGLREQGVWLRLLESAGADHTARLLFAIDSPSPRQKRDITSLLPPSRHPQIEWLEDGEALKAVIAPDHRERAFAAIIREGIAVQLVVGPPTEEVWERFESAL